ncbi:MAG: nitrilase [Proteobacteria bacterium]|nr:nitrilase [Pseudomonadota bacterium]
MERDVRIGLASMESRLGDREENLTRMRGLAREAAARGVEILCFPELSLTGYALSPELAALAEPPDGPFARRASALAAEFGMTVLFGMALANPDGPPFAAHLAAFPNGRSLSFLKVHVNPVERPFLSPGPGPVVIATPGFRFGMALCYDAHFPEMFTAMAMAGADAVFLPHASPRGGPRDKDSSWMRHLPARAFDNGMYVAAVNACGENSTGLSFPGLALVLDPLGQVMARSHGPESLLVADLSSQKLASVRKSPMAYFLPHRKSPLECRVVEV